MNTNTKLEADRDAMWREMETINKTSSEPMSRARFDELMSLDIDLDSLPNNSEPFDLPAKFDLEQEIRDRNVIAPEKVPGLVTIEGIIDLAIPVGYFSRACWASREMDAWLQNFANKVEWIHSGKLPEFNGKTIGELVEFAITYKRKEKLPEAKFKRLGFGGDLKWKELKNPNTDQIEAIHWALIYEAGQSQFWQVNADYRWMKINESQAKRLLKIEKKTALDDLGCDDTPEAVQTALHQVITFANVDYAGPVAGYPTGVYLSASGQRMLVTNSPNIVQPKKGSCARSET
jgi:hypothetical protein